MTKESSNKALVLGITGNFGRAHARALLADGWQVNLLVRDLKKLKDDALVDDVNVTLFPGDAMNLENILTAGEGCQVIIHGVNMAYDLWPKLMPQITNNILTAAKQLEATILFAGNIYNFSPDDGPMYDEQSPQHPITKKGAFRKKLEQDMAHFARTQAVQVIVLRAGDYWGPESSESSMFKYLVLDNVTKGKIWLAGRDDRQHCWAYLPDLAKIGVEILKRRGELNLFETFHSKGHELTGRQMTTAVEQVLGKSLKIGKFPWMLIKILGIFNATLREMLELRFMHNTSQSLNQNKLKNLLKEIPRTELNIALETVFKAHNIEIN